MASNEATSPSCHSNRDHCRTGPSKSRGLCSICSETWKLPSVWDWPGASWWFRPNLSPVSISRRRCPFTAASCAPEKDANREKQNTMKRWPASMGWRNRAEPADLWLLKAMFHRKVAENAKKNSFISGCVDFLVHIDRHTMSKCKMLLFSHWHRINQSFLV